MDAVPLENSVNPRSNPQRLLWVVYVLTVLSLIFQFVALVTPWWMVLTVSGISIQIGLWFASACYKGICKTKTYDEIQSENICVNILSNGSGDPDLTATYMGGDSSDESCDSDTETATIGSTTDTASEIEDYVEDDVLMEGRLETSAAVVCCVVAFGILMISVRRNPYDRRVTNVARVAGTLLLSGVLMIVAGGRFQTKTSTLSTLFSGLGDKYDVEIPTSAVIACVGGIVACFASFVAMAIVYQRNNLPNNYQEFNPGQQFQPGVVMAAPQGVPQVTGNAAASPGQTGMLPDPRASGYGYNQPN